MFTVDQSTKRINVRNSALTNTTKTANSCLTLSKETI